MNDAVLQALPHDPRPNFTCSYERAVDGKGRFNLPFRFQRAGTEAGVEKYVASEGPDGLLIVFPIGEWQRMFERVKGDSDSDERRAMVRRLSNGSRILDPDSQGRVMVPTEFLGRAGITNRVLVVGMGHYMELWDPERFQRAQEAAPAPDPEFTNAYYHQ